MATRRRIGISAATTEAARRQLMQPVQCWEKVWTVPDNGPAGSTLKVYRWMKTEKMQQFSDDEGEVDEPLAPLPDEPDVDEDLDQDEHPEAIPDVTDVTDLTGTQDDLSKPPSPKPQLSISLHSSSELSVDQSVDVLDASLNPLDESVDVGMDLEKDLPEDGIQLDMSSLGPHGLGLEESPDLSQIEEADTLIGGQAIDPFAK